MDLGVEETEVLEEGEEFNIRLGYLVVLEVKGDIVYFHLWYVHEMVGKIFVLFEFLGFF